MDLRRREDAAVGVAAAITGDGERVRPHVAAILKAADDYDSGLHPWYVAQFLSTATHESMMGRWMRERGSFKYFRKYRNILGNRGPADAYRYRGRGYVHLTGLDNYRKQLGRTGHRLVAMPELAERPDIAAEILVYGMMTGGFTGRKLGDYYPDHVAARAVVNGDVRKNGALIAKYHRRFQAAISDAPNHTSAAQELLREIGWSITVDGDPGPETERTVRWFQTGWTYDDLTIDGVAGPLTMRALRDCVRRDGRCSPNFWFREGMEIKYGHRWGFLHRELTRYLEKVRERSGRPVIVVSGWRSQRHQNFLRRTLGRIAARVSTHQDGWACDIASRQTRMTVAQLRAIDPRISIGWNRSTKFGSHVDIRNWFGRAIATWMYNR